MATFNKQREERNKMVDEVDGNLDWNLVTSKINCSSLRYRLESLDVYDASRSIVHLDDDQVALPILTDHLGSVSKMPFIGLLVKGLKKTKKKKKPSEKETQRDKLRGALRAFATENGTEWTKEMESDIPTKWERRGNLVIFPAKSFQHVQWKQLGRNDDENIETEEKEEEMMKDEEGKKKIVWCRVADALGAKRVALKETITNDRFRSPRVQLVLGDHSWVTHIDNGIKYSYDVTKCMFSAGNISEKLRIAKLGCKDEIVVDLYAGIGYFTLPYLVHAKASFVHACEWNPDSVKALEANLIQNGVQERCKIHFGDNRLVTPTFVAHRVNLGLIPSSEAGWEPACKALNRSTGGVLHIHGNVTSGCQASATTSATGSASGQPLEEPQRLSKKTRMEWTVWAETVRLRISDIFYSIHGTQWMVSIEHIERVKSYAPHIDHLVVDLHCTPPFNL